MFYDIYLYTLCYYICCLLWRMYEMYPALSFKTGCYSRAAIAHRKSQVTVSGSILVVIQSGARRPRAWPSQARVLARKWARVRAWRLQPPWLHPTTGTAGERTPRERPRGNTAATRLVARWRDTA
jgi:hypothetical protein